MKKQMVYANALGVPFVAIIGEQELESGVVNLKNMITGEQTALRPEDIAERVSQ